MMKISYKKFGAFAATAVLAGILAGCGSGMNADANDMARPAAMQQEKAAGLHRILWMQRMRISC